MDDNKPTNTEPEAPGLTETPSPANEPVESHMPEEVAEDTSMAPDTPSPTPVSEQTESVVSAPVEEKNVEPVVESHTPSAATAMKPPHGPMTMVVIIAILVVLALAVVAYFALVKEDTLQPSATSTKTQSVTAPTTDTDTASKNIDSSLNTIDDTKDYDQTSLNDSTLGL